MTGKLRTTANSLFSNYIRLLILISKGSTVLRSIFINQWNSCGGSKWEDSDANRKDFISGPGKNLFKKSQKIQKEYLSSRNVAEWDLPLLIQAVECLDKNAPLGVFNDLKALRNEFAHRGEPKVNDEEYDKCWNQISILLLQLNIPQEEIDQIKFAPIEKIKRTLKTFDPKIRELRDSGNGAFKTGRYDVAIDFYTEAISTPGVSNEVLAVIYSNRSIAFLRLKDVSSAKEDAKASIHLCPNWWKGYCRLGMAYKVSENYKLAFKNLMLAQQFCYNPSKLYNQINLCKYLNDQKDRIEHMDPMNFCKTYDELADKIPGSTPNSLELLHDWGIKFYGAVGMCTQGHNYLFGRGVQQDFKEAIKWYSKAAAKGNAEGMYNLAMMTIEGKGVDCDFSEGIRLLKQTASQPKIIELLKELRIQNLGVREAQHMLGLLYEKGTGVVKNFKQARHWYTLAIKNWSGPSANNMAFMYENGFGVAKSDELAIEYWKLGAAMGDVRCMENLLFRYFKIKDFESMQRWYLYAVQHGSIRLKFGLGLEWQSYFKEVITQTFQQEEFTTALWHDVKTGPLKNLIDLEVETVQNLMKIINTKFFSKLSPSPAYEIDSSSTEVYKKSIILAHRKEFNSYRIRASWGNKANLECKPVISLVNLKPIYLEEMLKKNTDHIYEGFVLKLIIVEDPIDTKSESAAIRSIVRDEPGLYQRLFIYNYHPTEDELQNRLGFGTKISIVNPYYRITGDGSPAIRVDDFNTVIVHDDLKNEKTCRYCGNDVYTGRPIPCRTCRRCYYCCKECLRLDASELAHVLVCKKRI